MKLPTALAANGDRLLHFPVVTSTMDEAKGLVGSLSTGRIWIVADFQTGGRGRQGRQWQSPLGNLHITLLMNAPCGLKDQPKLGFVAGVALCSAVRSLVSNPEDITIKWPNDILFQNAKISGLLLEGLEQGRAISIGIGVNIIAGPLNTPYPATFLNEGGGNISTDELFDRLAMALSDELHLFGDGFGFKSVRERWLGMAAHLNHSISVRDGKNWLEGILRDIDADGQLVLETADGTKLIAAGDVFPLDN